MCDLKKDDKDRGSLTFNVVGNIGEPPKMECHVDTDFAGLWNVEHNNHPVSSKSGTGFVMFVGNCPVIWQSKLQVETVLSTTEVEAVALSQAMRELIWLRHLTVDIASTLGTELKSKVEIKSKVFEDNNGANALVQARNNVAHQAHPHKALVFQITQKVTMNIKTPVPLLECTGSSLCSTFQRLAKSVSKSFSPHTETNIDHSHLTQIKKPEVLA